MYFFDLEDYAAFFRASDFTEHFNCNGYYNGKQSWLSDDGLTKIIWDNTMTPNCWSLSGDSFNTVKVINTNPAQPPINGNWTVVGLTYSVVSKEGDCPPPAELKMSVTKNNPTCTCNGSITILGSDGVPPYQYSFNNGVTYGNSPIINGLCGDIQLTVMIKDSEGMVKSQLVQMAPQQEQVTYTINLMDDGRETISNSSPNFSQKQKYTIQVTPALPNGVSITFALNVAGLFQRTPYSNSANSSLVSQIVKNGVNITNYTDNTTETTAPNTASSCQSYQLYRTNYEYNYTNLTFINSDVYEISVIYSHTLTCNNTPVNNSLSVEDENSIGPLGFGVGSGVGYRNCCNSGWFSDTVTASLTNTSINGCNCCDVRDWSYFYNRS